MSVRVGLIGRLGNNLFQYALGRIVAERHGLELECTQLRRQLPLFARWKLDTGPALGLEDLAAYFPNAPLRIAGRRVETPVERIEIGRMDGWRGHRIDLAALLADRSPRQIRLTGYFQRFDYYAPHLDRVRDWFRCELPHSAFRPASDDVLVNIRRGPDYGLYGWTLALSYYERILSGLTGLGQVYVCGTGVDDQVRRCLEPYRPIYYEGTPIEQFGFMQRFRRIVLSNSSFAWWAALLSDATEIYGPRAPHAEVWSFTGYREVDLDMREPRFHLVGGAAVAPFELYLRRAAAPDRIDDAEAPVNRELATWMVQQERPFTLSAVPGPLLNTDVETTVAHLVACGALALEPRYLDDDSDDSGRRLAELARAIGLIKVLRRLT